MHQLYPPRSPAHGFASAAGEMAERIRNHDWAATPLGLPEQWPWMLRFALDLCLHSSFPTAIYWGPELRLIYNDAWAPIPAERHPWALGRPAAEVWADIWHVIAPQMDGVLATGQGFSTFNQMLPMTRDGVVHETYWNYSFTPMRDEQGNIVGVVNQGHETTAQVIAERRLSEEVARQRRLFQQAPGFITVLHGPDHVFEFVNEAYARLFGDRDFVGRSVRDVFPDLAGQGVYDWLDTVYATGERFVAQQVPIEFQRTPGDAPELRYLDFIYEPVMDEHGQITGIFCEGHDVTEAYLAREALRELNDTLESRVEQRTAELAQAQEALRQSQKLEAMGQLTGGVAHDFNNLLTPIIGSLDMLQRRGVGDERAQRQIAGALASAERAKTLVQRLLAFARRQPLQPRPVDLGALIADMADLVASTSGPRIKVEVAVEPDLAPALADGNQLEMALLNLSVNARDAMPDGGTLTISASREHVGAGHSSELAPGPYARLSVSDTGIGMDEATLARAIEPFFSTKGVGQGTGLGLSMVHGLASQLGGALTLQSRPSFGTSVELWLPFAHQPVSGEEPRAEPPPPAGAGTVIVVDDEELVRASTAYMLGDLGYRVIEARSAEEALRHLRGGATVDLLVTDHLMPGMTGTDLAQTLRSEMPALPVLIVSGYAEDEGISPDLVKLTKPFRQADLAAGIAEITGRKSR